MLYINNKDALILIRINRLNLIRFFFKSCDIYSNYILKILWNDKLFFKIRSSKKRIYFHVALFK